MEEITQQPLYLATRMRPRRATGGTLGLQGVRGNLRRFPILLSGVNHHGLDKLHAQFAISLYGRELVAVDGTRTKAVNRRERNFTQENPNPRLQKADNRLEHYLKEMDEADAQDAGSSTASTTDLEAKTESLRKGPATLQAHGKTLKQSSESQLPLTDPDAWVMEARTECTRSQCGNCRQGPSAEGSSSSVFFRLAVVTSENKNVLRTSLP